MFGNGHYLEKMFEEYQNTPAEVDSSWETYFSEVNKSFPEGTHSTDSSSSKFKGSSDLSFKVRQLVKAYREEGHKLANVNPIEGSGNEDSELKLQLRRNLLERSGLLNVSLDEIVDGQDVLKNSEATLGQVIERLEMVYANRLGVEGLENLEEPHQKWLADQLESTPQRLFSSEEKYELLAWLSRAQLFEEFLHMKFVGQKRFSLEGEESIIPLLYSLIDSHAEEGGLELVLSMAHRGRLNVLAQILKKSYLEILSEFEEQVDFNIEDTGDVKYHKGYQGVWQFKGRRVDIKLTPNPSHLEAVGGVVLGQAYALQKDHGSERVLPVIIHGDAAVAAQGIVYESLQISGIKGYDTGGVIHIVMNNQVGFTTSPSEGRSTRYCTDIAKTFSYPVFHVSAEDPEMCVYAAELAFKMRQKFGVSTFIDVIGYRKWGHNESDEPRFTQPKFYSQIKNRPTIKEKYFSELQKDGSINEDEFHSFEEHLKECFQKDLEIATQDINDRKQHSVVPDFSPLETKMQASTFQKVYREPETAVPLDDLKRWGNDIFLIPEEFNAHRKIKNLWNQRIKMLEGDTEGIDWALAENLAYASLLAQGHEVRLSGQDSCRGTFSHRHAAIYDQETNEQYIPLAYLKDSKSRFEVYNSPLSEYAVMGFEYGYSLTHPNALVIWEAQFGDFFNTAQVIVDQFVSSARSKWGESNRLVLFLPHGYEGAGPEHSSARIERFLELSSGNNWIVANVTTPAQLFHLLRRHMLVAAQRPLILFTPKALLRHPKCISKMEALTQDHFHEIVYDPIDREVNSVKTLVLCSGKIYYDIVENVEIDESWQLARVEQLYPLAVDKILEGIYKLPNLERVVWIQEEPSNMGPLAWIQYKLKQILPQSIEFIGLGRKRTSATATGYSLRHRMELEWLMQSLKKAIRGVENQREESPSKSLASETGERV